MRNTADLLVIVFVFLLAGCGAPKYWIKGLTLPAGSTVVSQAETSNFQGMPAVPMMGTPDRILTVAFDNSAGWSSVSSHIDSCMQRQGYSDSMAQISSMAGSAAQGMPGGINPFDSMRMYARQDSKYSVMLMDMGAAMASAGAGSGGLPGVGSFQLVVMKMR